MLQLPANEAATCLQLSIDQLHNWGSKWRITFESSKSQAVAATLRRSDLALPLLQCGGISVPAATTITLLGVLFDQKLSLDDHLRSVATRARQRLGFLRRSAHLLSPASWETVYKAAVPLIMEYAPLVWMGAAHCQLSGPADQVQRKALRLLGPGVISQSLPVRRTVTALSCLNKLHYDAGSLHLLALLPQLRNPPTSPQTSGDHASVSGYAY